MEQLYHPQHLIFQKHSVRVSLKTGLHSAKPLKVTRWDRPPYDRKAKCYVFNKTLIKMFALCEDPYAVRRHFWECFGYLMCPSDIVKAKVVLYGAGNSGVTEAFETVKKIVTDEKLDRICVVATPPDIAHSDFDISYATAIPFFGKFKSIKEVPLYQFDTARDHEISGIVNHALKGLKRLITRGHFDPPQDCIYATEQYLRTADHVGHFIRERLILHESDEISVPMAYVYDEYRKWSEERQFTMGRDAFVREMISRGITYDRGPLQKQCFFGTSIIEFR